VSEEDVANPLHMEVRREVFDTVVRTRDLHTDRELKYWSNAYCRIYGTKENDVFFPENKKKSWKFAVFCSALCKYLEP
jgi:hypothetical protein